MRIMHGVVSNTVPRTTQGRFSMPQQLQSSRRRLERKNVGISGEERKFWQKELGSKTKDYTHHILQICEINVPEKRKLFV
jgi:hypothetical protein